MSSRDSWSSRWRGIWEAWLGNGNKWRRVGLVLLFGVLLSAVLYASLVPPRVTLQTGQVAPRDIKAPREIIDQVATERLRQQRAAEVPEVYDLVPQARMESLKQVAAFFREVGAIRQDQQTPEQAKLDAVQRLVSVHLPEEGMRYLLTCSAEELDHVEQLLTQLVDEAMDGGIKDSGLAAAREAVAHRAAGVEGPIPVREVLVVLAPSFLSPNLVYNAQETEQRRQQAMEAVEPVKILPGQFVVREGEIVTERHLQLLKELGLLRPEGQWKLGLGTLIVGQLLFGILVVCVGYFEKELLDDERRLVLLGLVVVAVAVLGRLVRPICGFLFPAAVGGMLLTALVGGRVGILGAVTLGAVAGLINGLDLRHALVALAGGISAVLACSRLQQRSDLLRAGAVSGLCGGGTLAALTLLTGGPWRGATTWFEHACALGNGLGSAVLSIGLLPFLELLFGIVTPMKLLELSNPNQPLLRRLLVEAPGTYHHSVMVANLSEAACDRLGADGLLARVGAYYHDIGKLKRPQFFIDNQLGGENPHDGLSPSLSRLIIASHVRDGVELANECGLPEAIIDFIREHHGTSLISYFYNRAAENGGKDQPPSESQYRYEGPRPRSRETAVVMLADATEAAVRALRRPTPAKVEAVVRKVVWDRLEDRQLDQSQLTLRDLDVVVDTFTQILTGIFHPRVEYPDRVLEEMEAEQEGGARRDQQ